MTLTEINFRRKVVGTFKVTAGFSSDITADHASRLTIQGDKVGLASLCKVSVHVEWTDLRPGYGLDLAIYSRPTAVP